jgi:hypothetical protein
MADAPKSGGSGWTALEIIVVLVLAIGLLDRLTGRETTPILGPGTTQPAADSKLDYSDPYCGLTLITPKRNASIAQSISLAGSVSGCNWNTDGKTALHAQITDANGLPLSEYLTIPISTKTTATANFAGIITLTAPAPTATGTLILIPATSSERNVSVRIPLRFVR